MGQFTGNTKRVEIKDKKQLINYGTVLFVVQIQGRSYNTTSHKQ